MTERTTDGRRIVYAPQSTSSLTGIISIALADNEDIEWHWSHSEAGSVVTGYTVRRQPDLCDKKLKRETLETKELK